MSLSGSHTGSKVGGFSLRIDWSATQSVSNNTSTVTAKAYVIIASGWSVQIGERTGVINIDGTNTTIKYTIGTVGPGTYHIGTASKTITHGTDGTKSFAISGNAKIEASITNYGWVGTIYKGSNTYTLRAIQRASQPTVNVSTQALGSAITIYTNRASSSFTHTLTYSLGWESGTIATGVTTSRSWTLPASLANAMQDTTSGTVTITCTTYNGSTNIGSKTVSLTATVPNNSTFRPTVAISSVVEKGSIPSGITVFIQNLSKVQITTDASPKYGAWGTDYRVSVAGTQIYSGRSHQVTSGILTNSGDITITVTYTDSRGYSATASKTINVKPYSWMVSKPTLNLSTRALGSAITIYTNRASSSFTHTISYKLGSQTGTINTGVGGSTSWTLLPSLADAIPNATSGSGTITCTTYSGSTVIGSEATSFTATVPNNSTFQPTATISNVIEGASFPSGITVFVQNQSKAKVISTGTGKYSAAIRNYSVTVEGIGTYTGSNITSALLKNSGGVRVTLTVTDSRGFQGSTYKDINVVAYSPPRISTLQASRSENAPANIAVNFNASITPITNQNKKYFRMRSKASDGSGAKETDSSQNYTFSGTETIASDTDKSYTIELFVEDSFSSVTQTVLVGTAFTLMDFNESGKGMAIGKVSEKDALEIGMTAYDKNGVEILGMAQGDLPNGTDLHEVSGGIHRLGGNGQYVNGDGSMYGTLIVLKPRPYDDSGKVLVYIQEGGIRMLIKTYWNEWSVWRPYDYVW